MSVRPDNIEALVRSCLRGRRLAQRQLYESYLPYVLTVVRRYGVRDAERADLAQEIFADVFKNLGAFDGRRAEFSTWLRTISVRRTVDYLRRHRALILPGELMVQEKGYGTEDYSSFSTDHILEAIAELPDGYRTVFNLAVVDGLTHREIADFLNITESASRSQLARAKRSLRARLTTTPQKRSVV